MKVEFFMPMIPPTITAQEHKIVVKDGKPIFFDPPELAAAKQKLMAHLAKHSPPEPFRSGVQLLVKWCFPRGSHADGEYRITKPDTDNLQKLLKDCMTRTGYWTDDARVASESVEKFWAEISGIWIGIWELP